jgi:phosphoenolpyruvate carboxykinase (ATP)
MTQNKMGIASNYGLKEHGLRNLNMSYWNLTTPALVERIISRREGVLAHEGAVVVRTGHHTGRAPNDKFIVCCQDDHDNIWWGKVNKEFKPEQFERLYQLMCSFFQGRDVFVQDTTAGAHPDYKLPIRVITESAWHNLFARNLFIRLPVDELPNHVPEFTIIQAPSFHADPEEDGTNSEVFVILNLERRIILIGGTSYAGEIKKSIFTTLNYLLPLKGVLSMHCSANVGKAGDTALFFGLSGTGKTTLSSDPERALIGDDEHGWADDGVFNFEGGCYAKTINLRQEYEPLIWKATRRFGTVLENITLDQYTRRINYDDDSLTENTRAAYPVGFLDNIVPGGRGGHPTNIFFLTADAFGVMPPIARLTPEQAMYYFLSGYTSKLAGTEKGVKEPQTTFSTCFGAPFLPLYPHVYANLLGDKIQKHKSKVWLINTGWTGGPFGIGSRFRIPYTRAMIRAALTGALESMPTRRDPYFGIAIPEHVPDVPDEVLDPRGTWADPQAYDAQANLLVSKFIDNFKQFESQVSQAVIAAGPATQ